MYHVCYLSYSKSLNLYYIGKKSFEEWSDFYKYKTSSSNSEFRKSFKTKTILGYYNNSKEAVEAEIYFQHLFKVKDNPLFANMCYQTSKGFDTFGMRFNLTKEQKTNLRKNQWPKCSIKRNVNKKKTSFSKEDLELIRNLLKEGMSQVDIAKQFNVNQSTISRIKRRNRYAYN